MPDSRALTVRCPACHGVAELAGMTGTALVYECACGERVEEAPEPPPELIFGRVRVGGRLIEGDGPPSTWREVG